MPCVCGIKAPAEDWNSALPLGNGKLGAMVFGGPVAERIQLNEDSVWSGGFRDRVNPDCKNNLPEIRRLLREGDIAQAENLATLAMAGTPEFERMYQTLGDIYLTMENQAGEVEHYTRQLDLDNALCTVSYTSGGVDYTREVYISAPHNVMVVRLGSSRKGGVSFQVRMHRGRYTDGTFQDKEQNAIYYNRRRGHPVLLHAAGLCRGRHRGGGGGVPGGKKTPTRRPSPGQPPPPTAWRTRWRSAAGCWTPRPCRSGSCGRPTSRTTRLCTTAPASPWQRTAPWRSCPPMRAWPASRTGV